VSVRVRSVQPGWDWWWVLDNFSVNGRYILPIVADPSSFAATASSDTEIILDFTTNPNSDNVVIVWNTIGTFTEPSGTPPLAGQPFAGGTLLYNGTTTPVSHSGLNQQTVYYYKAFSYDNTDYSTGIEANDTTFETIIPKDFTVNLLIEDNCTNSISLMFGTAPGATPCFDLGLDELAPPPPPQGAFDGRFISCNNAFFKDFRATNPDGERIWDITYQPANGCEPVTLSWDPAQLPVDGYFHLVDPFLGTLVNVNMRLRNSYSDVQDIGILQIKYNYEICSNYGITEGWNMLSLPLGVANSNYLSLFPNANPGTLFGYSDGYFTTETVGTCTGYWLKFPGAETAQVCGSDITECVIDLSEGWNMIGGPNCNVPIGSVVDPGGIIVAGTLFGYDGGYFTASSIDATKAYWIKTNASGTITVSCGVLPNNNQEKELIIAKETVDSFSRIEISDAGKNNQTLYFGSKLDEETSIESFSMPPLPPQGSFDARLTGDYRLSEFDEVTIQIQSSDYPIVVKVSNLDEEEAMGYVLNEIASGIEVGSKRIVSGKDIVISNEEVSMLKIEKQQALPTEYSLEQNYPNPFNPSTIIKFAVPKESFVNLSIFNVLGELVSQLVNEQKKPGQYEY
jgi:hypothetical protein